MEEKNIIDFKSQNKQQKQTSIENKFINIKVYVKKKLQSTK